MKVLITGTFDPMTIGHADMIYKASIIFGAITVVIMNNLDKEHMLKAYQRKSIADASVPKGIEVIYSNCYINELIDYYSDEDVVLVRGLRNSNDYEYEKNVESVTDACGAITVYINAIPEYNHVSSSLIRNLILTKCDYSKYMATDKSYELMKEYLSE